MTDEQIIDLYFSRSEDAIAQTDTVYGRRLRGLSRRIVRSSEDAEECVNDTYLKTWNAVPPRRPSRFFAFLAAICRNVCLNLLDWEQAGKRHAEIVTITEEMEQCLPDTAQERILRGRELGKALDDFLGTLPKESRTIFLRRYWYADTIADIAKRYGITESKVKMQLLRTRGKLKEYLEKEGISV